MVERSPNVQDQNEEVREAIQAIVTVARIFGYKGKGEVSPTVEHWVSLGKAAGVRWAKIAKYKLAAFYSYHKKQPIPEAPFKPAGLDRPDMLVGGGTGRFLSSIMHHEGVVKDELLQSIKQSKKGMPRSTPAILQQVKEEYLAKVITPIPEPNAARGLSKGLNESLLVSLGEASELVSLGVEPILSQKTVEEQLRRTVRELFPPGKYQYTMEDRQKMFFPSTSANYINNRKKAGAVGSIMDHPTLLKGLRTPGGYLESNPILQEEKEEEHIENRQYRTIQREIMLQQKFNILWDRILDEAKKELPRVELHILAEPTKERAITAMAPMMQTVMKNYMRFIRKRLAEWKIFRLTHEPISEEIMLDLLGFDLKSWEAYLSGDYANATDDFKLWVSRTMADELAYCTNLHPTERVILQITLTGNLFETGMQQRSQLMGSITSFPLLCIANAAMTRWSAEVADRRVYKLQDCRMGINGDDVALRAHRRVYGIWQRITAMAGLKESIGKTYLSDKFVEMNSTQFNRTETPNWIVCRVTDSQKSPSGNVVRTTKMVMRATKLKLVKYVNLGLLKGYKRADGRSHQKATIADQDDPNSNLGTLARELLKFAPERLHEECMKEFIQAHKKPLQVMSKMHIPWYIPEWLGGVGLPSGPWGQPSELDMRLAREIILNWKIRRPVSLAHQGMQWKTWQLAEKRMPEPYYTNQKTSATETYNHMVGVQCINLLFDSNVRMTDMFDGLGMGGGVSKALKKNSALWTPGKRSLPAPLKAEDVLFRPLYPNYVDSTSRLERTKSEGYNLD